MASNKKIGNTFETELCETLFEYGFWSHNFTQNQAGQPADVIAVRNMRPYLIDCKVCEHDRFLLTRIEENQMNAMKLWQSCGNGSGWFALKISSGIYFIALADLELHGVLKKRKALTETSIKKLGYPLERWCECRFM